MDSIETRHQADHPKLASASRTCAVTALVVVNLLWGFSFPLAKTLSLEIQGHFEPNSTTISNGLLIGGSAWIIAIRFAMAFALIVVCCRPLIRTVAWPHIRSGFAIGTLFFAGLLLQVAGLATIPASRSGFLTSLVVVWTPIFSTLLQRQFPRRLTVAGAMVSIVGVSILTGMIEFNAGGFTIADDAFSKWQIGDTLTSIAVLFFALQIILVDVLGKRYESTAFTPSMFATTMIWAFVVFFSLQLTAQSTLDSDAGVPDAVISDIVVNTSIGSVSSWWELTCEPRFWIPIALLSVFSTLIAFLWMNRYQPILSSAQAAVIYTLEPLFASTWAMFLPGWMTVLCGVTYANEALTWNLVIGGALLILANGIVLWPTAPDRSKN